MKDDMKEEVGMIWDKLDGWYETFVVMLPNILIALLIGIAIFFISKGVKILMKRYLLAKWQNEELKNITAKVVQIVIICLGFLFALSIVNLDKTVTSILAGVGVAGIAIGFAFQDIAANFISGLFMAANKPFAVGDVIEVEGINGTVKALSLRTTVIKTFNGNDIIIPNSTVFQNPLTNYSTAPERRIDLAVGVSYNDDLKEVKKLSKEAINTVNGIHKNKDIQVFFTEFGGSSVNFEVRFWMEDAGRDNIVEVKSDAIEAIKTIFDKNNIDIPFPIRTLDLSKSKEILSSISKA